MRSLKTLMVTAAMTVCALHAAGQQSRVLLWPDGAPGQPAMRAGESIAPIVRITPDGEHVITHVIAPVIIPYLPAHGTGAAVIVIPGGGHSELWSEHEGANVAAWLQAHGVAAFVLEYRLAREKGSAFTVEGTELGDVQRALRLVRSRSAEWHVNPEHIGVMGFSAGGELGELAATRSDPGNTAASDPLDRLSSRPAFEALIYPALPVDLRLTAQMPPAFLACGAEDRTNISEGLATFYGALHALHVPVELHIYAGVGHGFGMRWSNPPAVSRWMDLLLDWMGTMKMLGI